MNCFSSPFASIAGSEECDAFVLALTVRRAKFDYSLVVENGEGTLIAILHFARCECSAVNSHGVFLVHYHFNYASTSLCC